MAQEIYIIDDDSSSLPIFKELFSFKIVGDTKTMYGGPK